MPNNQTGAVEIPLARWANHQLRLLAEETGTQAITTLKGSTLLGERAGLNRLMIPGRRSAGRKCHLLAAQGGWVAINLARDGDRELLPALFERRISDTADLGEIAELVFACDADKLVSRGREMGMAIAHSAERTAIPPLQILAKPIPALAPVNKKPLVVDLSALWAGPLCSHLLQMAGARVIKVESLSRTDSMRQGDPDFFALLNQGKDSVSIDLASHSGLGNLHHMLTQADIVIEAARPRALAQLGIDASQYLAAKPGLTWISITGHGAQGEVADWIGFGDDCGVAGGLTLALQEASGTPGFVGDAIGDPLSGIMAARSAWSAWVCGAGGRIGLSMSGIVKQAIGDEQAANPARLTQELQNWAYASGRPFPADDCRQITSEIRPLGADNQQWLPC